MPRRYYPLARTLVALILAGIIFSFYKGRPRHSPQADELAEGWASTSNANYTALALKLVEDEQSEQNDKHKSDSLLTNTLTASDALNHDLLPGDAQSKSDDRPVPDTPPTDGRYKHDDKPDLIPSQPDASGFAYLFYATSNFYACSVLVNIYRLKHTLNAIYPIHVLISPSVSPSYAKALQNVSAIIHVQDPPRMPDNSSAYYSGCLLKLLAFKMHVLDSSLKRVLIFDSDQLILKNLDHLFTGLPPSDLAAPRAYWISKDWISSAFMMIIPSDRVWNSISTVLDDLPADKYDMDIVNDLFGMTVTMLGGEFITMNSHWEVWDLPNWYHPAISTGLADANPAPMDPQNALNTDANAFLKPGADPIHNASRQALSLELYHLQEAVSVLHFSAVGKPWTYSVGDIRERRPNAHPLLAEQFALWHQIAAQVCPTKVVWNRTVYG